MQIAMTTTGGGVSNLKLKIWEGGTSVSNPGTLLVDQPVDMASITNNAWTTIDLATPFEIDATKELRIGYELTHVANVNPLPLLYDFGPHVSNKSDLLCAGDWTTLYDVLGDAGCDWNACIKAGIEGGINISEVIRYDIYQDDVKFGEVAAPATTFTKTGVEGKHNYCVVAVYDNDAQSQKVCKEISCGEVPPPCNEVTGAKAEIADCAKATITWIAVTGAKEYEVTRDGNTTTVTAPSYTEDAEFEEGKTYEWEIVTVCAENKSDAVKVTAECLSGINELSNSVAIYPNPSNSMVTITAANFAKVEIYNTVGQLVETKTVNTVDVSSYNTGIYFFKVYDGNNNSVTKRIMVTK
jgi:hypothetical protein